MDDARRQQEPREYAQKIIQWAKSAEIELVFNQLNVMYNDIEVKLRRDFYKFINTIIIDDYLLEFNVCKNI